jgi:hypothetical protein
MIHTGMHDHCLCAKHNIGSTNLLPSSCELQDANKYDGLTKGHTWRGQSHMPAQVIKLAETGHHTGRPVHAVRAGMIYNMPNRRSQLRGA